MNLTQGKWRFGSTAHWIRFIESVPEEILVACYAKFDETTNPRTLKQNNTIHAWFPRQAKLMNDAGFTQRKFFDMSKEGFDVDWTAEAIKEVIWRKIQIAVTKKTSTTKLDTKEVDKVYQTIVRGLGDMGIPTESLN